MYKVSFWTAWKIWLINNFCVTLQIRFFSFVFFFAFFEEVTFYGYFNLKISKVLFWHKMMYVWLSLGTSSETQIFEIWVLKFCKAQKISLSLEYFSRASRLMEILKYGISQNWPQNSILKIAKSNQNGLLNIFLKAF